MVWLLHSSGVRADDAAQLTIPAIDFEMGELFIEDGKGDSGGELSSFGPHRLRHGMATYMAEQGVDQHEIQRWGG
jgi:site-specific recombinase XerD